MNYGTPYSPQYAQQAARAAYPMTYAGPAYQRPLVRTGQEGKEEGAWDKTKTWLDKSTWNLQRKYWLGGAAALGTIYYLYRRGTFGKPRRFAF